MNQRLLDEIARAPVVPTVMPLSPDALCRYMRVLSEEGYPALEILCRPLEQALDVVARINERPERSLIAIGIGTILNGSAAEQAVRLGPDFLVSPAFSRRVLGVAARAGIPYIPGVRTFQDVQDVLDAFEDEGLSVEVLKLCPVDGLSFDYVAMLANCFPGILYCPTGEVTLGNYVQWKTNPSVAAPMGSELIPRSCIENPDPEPLRERLRMLREMSQRIDAVVAREVAGPVGIPGV